MSATATRDSRLILATLIAVAFSAIGMIATAILHAQIGHSKPLALLIVLSSIASLIGAIGGLLLAGRRRNVMWILALAVSMTALMVLLATVVASFGPD